LNKNNELVIEKPFEAGEKVVGPTIGTALYPDE